LRLTVASTLFIPAIVNAQAPQQTTATYGDWTVVCGNTPGGQKSCELVHTQTIQGHPNPVGQITISRLSKTEPFKILIQIPPNVWLQTGVKFIFDDKDSGLSATLRWCAPTRCLADAALTDETIKKLHARTEPGRVEFKE